MTGLTIPKKHDHDREDEAVSEALTSEPSSPFPRLGTLFSLNYSPVAAPAVSEQKATSVAFGPAQPQFIHPSTLHLQGFAKGLKKGLPGKILGDPFTRHDKRLPSYLNASGLLHET